MKMGPIAIFDIGSNAVRLTVYAMAGASPKIVTKAVELCELGRVLDQDHCLYPDGVQKAFQALDRYIQTITQTHPCSSYIAVATEAVRRATDGPDFVQTIKSRHGLDVHVLTEEEEGRYGAMGVHRLLPHAEGIVADLGGGSLQLTSIFNHRTVISCSLPLGTLRLETQEPALSIQIERHMATVPDKLRAAQNLYVIGGSWRSFARLYMTRAGLKPQDHTTEPLEPAKIRALAHWLSETTSGDIRKTLIHDYYLEPARAETMPQAASLLAYLTTFLDVEQVHVSAAGLRDGLVEAIIKGELIPLSWNRQAQFSPA
jgi:exopolyphosphatase/guanosine-5'-triphosphate,3'-diphosphate pyrophosphatase